MKRVDSEQKKMVSLFASLLFTRGFFLIFLFFSFLTNSFQWLFKLENGNVAPALYFGCSVLATEQFSIIRDKRHRTVHSDKKEEKKPMIAGLPVCHLATKSSPSRPTTVLSDLIMWRIKSRGEKEGLCCTPGPQSLVTDINCNF